MSTALGFGFRCGFLGLLHMDIVQERLEREYNLELITSAPTVVYEILRTDGKTEYVDNPSKLPPGNEIAELREPIITANILLPPEHVGAVHQAVHRQARQADEDAVSGQPGIAAVRIAAGRGGARFLRPARSRSAAAMRRSTTSSTASRRRRWSSSTCSINGDRVDALSLIVHRDNAYQPRP